MRKTIWVIRSAVAHSNCIWRDVDSRTQVVPRLVHAEHTCCPQLDWVKKGECIHCILCIQFLPQLGHLFADHKVEFDRFLDLFDGMYGSGVVFASQFAGDQRETEVKLAAQ